MEASVRPQAKGSSVLFDLQRIVAGTVEVLRALAYVDCRIDASASDTKERAAWRDCWQKAVSELTIASEERATCWVGLA